MATFEHGPIDVTQPTFRLVRLLAGSGAEIQCEMIHAWFNRPEALIPYEALSYTWGSDQLVDEIKLDGRLCRVTQNLYIALQYLRSEDQDRILWIDGLCIDQGKDKEKEKEKTHQIRQMGAIYNRAERVIFWLGQATYETNVVMDSLKLLEEESLKYPRNSKDNQVPKRFVPSVLETMLFISCIPNTFSEILPIVRLALETF
jgi:Heterokaryon incompatibility protein (HET)